MPHEYDKKKDINLLLDIPKATLVKFREWKSTRSIFFYLKMPLFDDPSKRLTNVIKESKHDQPNDDR